MIIKIIIGVIVLLLVAGLLVFKKCFDMSFDNKSVQSKEEDWDNEKDLFRPTSRLRQECIKKYMPFFESLGYEDIYIESFDHLKLYSRFYRGTNNEYIICLHGYKGESSACFCDVSSFYTRRGSNMLLVDHRSHGKSEGRYIGFGELEIEDVKKWVEYINEHFENPKIYLHGLSMGGAIALHCADKDLKNLYGIIDDCGFDTASNVFKAHCKKNLKIPYFPLMPLAFLWAKILAKNDLYKSNGLKIVQNSKVPILFIHGTLDAFVPIQMSLDMYEACNSSKKLFVVEKAGHCGSYCLNQTGYEKALEEMLNGEI